MFLQRISHNSAVIYTQTFPRRSIHHGSNCPSKFVIIGRLFDIAVLAVMTPPHLVCLSCLQNQALWTVGQTRHCSTLYPSVNSLFRQEPLFIGNYQSLPHSASLLMLFSKLGQTYFRVEISALLSKGA